MYVLCLLRAQIVHDLNVADASELKHHTISCPLWQPGAAQMHAYLGVGLLGSVWGCAGV